MKTEALFKELEKACQDAFDGGVEVTDAEKLAARCLQGQIIIARELERLDLEARLKKNEVKTIRAQVYMEEVQKADKKPSDTMLEQMCTLDKSVSAATDAYDAADTHRVALERYLAIFKDGHIYFRGIAKGVYS